jgi:elongation factor Tu
MSAEFRMTVRDLYTLSGLGVVATGQIESGSVKDGDALDLLSGKRRKPVRVLQIESFAKRLSSASAGPEEVGIVLSGVSREEVKPGQVLTSRAAEKTPPRNGKPGRK